ncbi:MAG: hypothetical protein RIQ94_2503 [Pseudomonadota bacterium]|jgi:hypothetical protein
MIGGFPDTRYFITGFTSDTEHFEIELPPHVTFEDVQGVIGADVCPNVQELNGCYPLHKDDLVKLGIDISLLPDAEYFFEFENK